MVFTQESNFPEFHVGLGRPATSSNQCPGDRRIFAWRINAQKISFKMPKRCFITQ
jgi:hypothetical protein